MTKEERAEYMKKYRAEHKEEIYITRKRWSMKNQERIDKAQKEYAEAHREEIRAYHKAYRKDYYNKHKDDADFKENRKIYRDNWLKLNRNKWNDYQREYQRKRRALGVSNGYSSIERFTDEKQAWIQN